MSGYNLKKKVRADSDIPRPRIKKAGDRSSRVNDFIFVSGGMSVKHCLVTGKLIRLPWAIIPLAQKRRINLNFLKYKIIKFVS